MCGLDGRLMRRLLREVLHPIALQVQLGSRDFSREADAVRVWGSFVVIEARLYRFVLTQPHC